MKYGIVNRAEFNRIVADFDYGTALGLEIFKKMVIGAIIDDCFYNKKVIIIDNNVFVIENNDREGLVVDTLDNIQSETINEWIAKVNLVLLP